MTIRVVHRYRGALAGALALVIVGTVFGEAWVVALAGVPVAFVAYGSLSGVPEPELVVEREADPERPVPGDRVGIRLTVENRSDRPLADVRIADVPPEELSVVGGAPGAAVAIGPGETETVRYELLAKRGEHGFGEPRIRVRGAAGSSYRDLAPPVGGVEEVTGRVFVEEPPTRRETATLVGAVPTDAGGSGIEFHTTREYRPGDPVNRIDWRRLARGGGLSTVDFREHRGVAVVVLADCRSSVDRVPEPGAPSSVELCRYAADRTLHAFVEASHDVGAAVLGPGATPWVEPGRSDVLARGRVALRSVDGDPWGGPELGIRGAVGADDLVDRLIPRLPANGQLVLVTPLLDDLPIELCRALAVRGHPATVISPDMGEPTAPGARLHAAERLSRIDRLRETGARVVDWPRSEPLPVAVEAAEVTV